PGRLLRDEIRRVPVQLAPWQARDDEYALRRVLALVDRGAEGVELVQTCALLVRHEEAHTLEPLAEALGDPRPQLVEPFAGERGDLERVRVAVCESAPAERVEGVDLVHDELDGQVVRSDLAQDAVDGGDLLDEDLIGCGPVDDVED